MITQQATVNNETPTAEDYRILATELRDFLMTNTASRLHPEAHVMGTYLTILLTSCTQLEADECLEVEYKSILNILGKKGE